MGVAISVEEVANVATLIAPGYFFILGYSLIYSRNEKNFSKVLVESIAFSLPIVGIYNFIWKWIADDNTIKTTDLNYFMPLILGAVLLGFGISHLRKTKRVRKIATKLNIPGPDTDFIKVQFQKLKTNSTVTVTLKNGEVFSGTPKSLGTYVKGNPREYTFNNIAWYKPNARTNKWDYREGTLIININEIQYIETSERLKDD